jgi:hypothetical protein
MFSMMRRYIVICRMNINNSKDLEIAFRILWLKKIAFVVIANINRQMYWIRIEFNFWRILLILRWQRNSDVFLCARHHFRNHSIAKKRRREFNSSIEIHFRHTKFKFIELLFRRANFAKTRHDLIDTEFLYE